MTRSKVCIERRCLVADVGGAFRLKTEYCLRVCPVLINDVEIVESLSDKKNFVRPGPAEGGQFAQGRIVRLAISVGNKDAGIVLEQYVSIDGVDQVAFVVL